MRWDKFKTKLAKAIVPALASKTITTPDAQTTVPCVCIITQTQVNVNDFPVKLF